MPARRGHYNQEKGKIERIIFRGEKKGKRENIISANVFRGEMKMRAEKHSTRRKKKGIDSLIFPFFYEKEK